MYSRAVMDVRSHRLRSSVLVAALGVALGVALAAGSVGAQAPPSGLGVESRTRFDEGLRALAEQRYGDAERALRVVSERDPRAIVWFNLGLALRGIGRYVEAVEVLDRYLVSPDPAHSPAVLAGLRGEVENLRRSRAQLRVTSTPPGASLRVDGRARTPRDAPVWLDSGAHTVELSAEGRVPWSREVQLTAGQSLEVIADLVPMPAPVPAPVEAWAAMPTPAVDARVRVDPPARTSSRPGWVVPVVVVSGLALVAGVVTATVLLSRDSVVAPEPGSWDQFRTH